MGLSMHVNYGTFKGMEEDESTDATKSSSQFSGSKIGQQKGKFPDHIDQSSYSKSSSTAKTAKEMSSKCPITDLKSSTEAEMNLKNKRTMENLAQIDPIKKLPKSFSNNNQAKVKVQDELARKKSTEAKSSRHVKMNLRNFLKSTNTSLQHLRPSPGKLMMEKAEAIKYGNQRERVKKDMENRMNDLSSSVAESKSTSVTGRSYAKGRSENSSSNLTNLKLSQRYATPNERKKKPKIILRSMKKMKNAEKEKISSVKNEQTTTKGAAAARISTNLKLNQRKADENERFKRARKSFRSIRQQQQQQQSEISSSSKSSNNSSIYQSSPQPMIIELTQDIPSVQGITTSQIPQTPQMSQISQIHSQSSSANYSSTPMNTMLMKKE